MKRSTVSEAIEAIENPKPDKSHLELEIEILRSIPGDIICPSVSNLSEKPDSTGCGWLSWSKYGFRSVDAVEILTALEDAGWRLLPATLAKWDHYRPSVSMGWIEDLPERKREGRYGNYALTDSWEIMPVWISHSYHHVGEPHRLNLFMVSPNGTPCKISIGGRFRAGHMTANRRDFIGGWEYERGTAKMNNADTLWNMADDDGNHISQMSSMSYCTISHGGQSLDGRTYWEPIVNREQFESIPASHYAKQLI